MPILTQEELKTELSHYGGRAMEKLLDRFEDQGYKTWRLSDRIKKEASQESDNLSDSNIIRKSK